MEIILRRVECIATYGEVREEPCLMWRIDDDDEQYGSRCLASEHGMRAGGTVNLAQEWKDYVFIKVDGQTVWGPTRMRDTGDASRKTVDRQINIRRNSVISLWEKDGDGNRSDHFGSYELNITDDFDFDHDPEPIRYHYDRAGSDATYYLTYRVSCECVWR